jgi:hypothetical protein
MHWSLGLDLFHRGDAEDAELDDFLFAVERTAKRISSARLRLATIEVFGPCSLSMVMVFRFLVVPTTKNK